MAKAPVRDPRDAAVDALMALAAERPWAEIDLTDIADRAGLTLQDLRASFPSKGSILASFSRRIDLAVLADEAKDMANEPVRERLFDVLMRRFDALRPYRAALRSIRDGLVGDPLSMAALNRVTLTAMQWMLAAAGAGEEGPFGALKAQGLVLLYARVSSTFLDDEDPGLARTLKALDGELRTAERWAERLGSMERLSRAFVDSVTGLRRRDRTRTESPPEPELPLGDTTSPPI